MVPPLSHEHTAHDQQEHEKQSFMAKQAINVVLETLDLKKDEYCLAGRFMSADYGMQRTAE
jgi:hypothetical protein